MYEDVYNRQVYTLMDMMSDLGGVQTIFKFIGAILAGAVAERLMHSEMMK